MTGDVVDMITDDHREVERLLGILQHNPEQRPLMVPVVAALLMAHDRAEEAEVYPAARTEAGEEEETAHSSQEHSQTEAVLYAYAVPKRGDTVPSDVRQRARTGSPIWGATFVARKWA